MEIFNDLLIFECPHCSIFVVVEKKDLNCKIFRHGNFIINKEPINPHTSKADCEELIKNNKIYGCGKPFKINVEDNKFTVEICDYI